MFLLPFHASTGSKGLHAVSWLGVLAKPRVSLSRQVSPLPSSVAGWSPNVTWPFAWGSFSNSNKGAGGSSVLCSHVSVWPSEILRVQKSSFTGF